MFALLLQAPCIGDDGGAVVHGAQCSLGNDRLEVGVCKVRDVRLAVDAAA